MAVVAGASQLHELHRDSSALLLVQYHIEYCACCVVMFLIQKHVDIVNKVAQAKYTSLHTLAYTAYSFLWLYAFSNFPCIYFVVLVNCFKHLLQ